MRRLRLGMVGGGQGAFIGGVHRIAARLDDRWQLVAGALSSDPDRAAASASEVGIAADRSYSDFREMALAEAALDDAEHEAGASIDSEYANAGVNDPKILVDSSGGTPIRVFPGAYVDL